LASFFLLCPHPLAHIAHNGLATIIDGDMLDLDRLLASSAVLLKGFDLARERSGELVQHVRSAVSPGNGFGAGQTARGDNRGIVDRRHLNRQVAARDMGDRSYRTHG
jgi:hypothetical protein